MLGAVARLLLSEKPKCNVAIRTKIKVRSSCMYLFTIQWTVADALNVHKNSFEFDIGNYLISTSFTSGKFKIA